MTGFRGGSFLTGFAFGAAALLACVLVWGELSRPGVALAQVPDSGAQRAQMIAELKTANIRLGEMLVVLREIRDGEKPKGGEPPPAKPGRP